MPRVAVVEDNPEIQDWIFNQFTHSKNWTIQHTFFSAEQAIDNLTKLNLDLIILDIGLPGKSGIDLIPILKTHFPDIKILIFTVFEDEEMILKAISNGCHGYWIKNFSYGFDLINECQHILDGGASLTPKIARFLMDHISKSNQSADSNLILTDREKEVLNMVAVGFRIDDIADELDLSTHTIRHTLERIYLKLDVNSKREAILKGNRMGIIKKPDEF